MSGQSSIEWTEATWNPVTGCSKISPGCAHCYAEAISLRFGWSALPWTPANAAENVVLHPERLDAPLRWRRPRMVFVNSMSDLFHEEVPPEFVWRVIDIMREARQHTFQVLTKRPERMRQLVNAWYALSSPLGDAEPLPNVWLGVSIENRRFVGRADVLRGTHAAVRFISAEPLLGPLVPEPGTPSTGVHAWGDSRNRVNRLPGLRLDRIDWLIVGGESGPGHRPMRVEWARDLADAAERAGVAFFLKQLGGARPGGALEDLPPDLRIREFPRQAVTA